MSTVSVLARLFTATIFPASPAGAAGAAEVAEAGEAVGAIFFSGAGAGVSSATTAPASPAVKLANRPSHNECLIDLIIVMWIRSGRAGGRAKTPAPSPRPSWFVGSILFSMLFALAIPLGKRRAAVFVRSFPKPKTCQRNLLPCHIFAARPATDAPRPGIRPRASQRQRAPGGPTAAAPSDFL